MGTVLHIAETAQMMHGTKPTSEAMSHTAKDICKTWQNVLVRIAESVGCSPEMLASNSTRNLLLTWQGQFHVLGLLDPPSPTEWP